MALAQGSYALLCLDYWYLKASLSLNEFCKERKINPVLRNETFRMLYRAHAMYSLELTPYPMNSVMHRCDFSNLAEPTLPNIMQALQDGEMPDDRCLVDFKAGMERVFKR